MLAFSNISNPSLQNNKKTILKQIAFLKKYPEAQKSLTGMLTRTARINATSVYIRKDKSPPRK